jgi:hypothetical protein
VRTEPTDAPRAGDKLAEAAWKSKQKPSPRVAVLAEDERRDKDGPNEPEKENDDGHQL